MVNGSDRGVAYAFWLRVQSEQAARGWTDVELKSRSGIPRTTVDRLAKGRRPPLARVVNALADVLDIPRAEAHQLAGLVPRPPAVPDQTWPQVTVRDAIMQDPNYDDRQRQIMLQVVDLLEQAGGGGTEGRRAG